MGEVIDPGVLQAISARAAESRPARHFDLLDGLRGVAAIAVVMFHFGERAGLSLFPHGYLAVDFFFVLSGFVVARAYTPRLRAGLGLSAFVTTRLIRLVPMLVPGTLLGAAFEFGRPIGTTFWRHLGETGLALVLGVLMIPLPFATSLEHTIFPINGPVWSLFFEMMANIALVAVVAWRRPVAGAWWIAVLSGAALVAIGATHGGINFGFWIGDWGFGVPRVMFSFFAGTLLYARPLRLRRLPPWIYPVVLMMILLAPHLSGLAGAMFDLAVILTGFPLLVAAAACQCRALPNWAGSLPGRLSYPIYAIHYPIVRAVTFLMTRHGASAPARLAVACLTIVAVSLLGYALLRWFDEPARRVLARLQAKQRRKDLLF